LFTYDSYYVIIDKGGLGMKFNDKIMIEDYLNEAPIKAKGWSQNSIEKFEKTIGKKADEKGFFDACVSHMKKYMGDQAEGFCAALKDSKYNSPSWRGKDKTEKEAKKDTEEDQYPKSKRLPKYRKKKK